MPRLRGCLRNETQHSSWHLISASGGRAFGELRDQRPGFKILVEPSGAQGLGQIVGEEIRYDDAGRY